MRFALFILTLVFSPLASAATLPNLSCSFFESSWNSESRTQIGQSVLQWNRRLGRYVNMDGQEDTVLSVQPLIYFQAKFKEIYLGYPLVDFFLKEDRGGDMRIRSIRTLGLIPGATRVLLSGNTHANADQVFTAECEAH